MADFKLQAARGGDLNDWDQRKSAGEFQGAPEGVHIRTIAEFRTDDDLLTNPDRVAEFIQPGEPLISVVNRALALATKDQPDTFGHVASLVGLGGSGDVQLKLHVYDND